MLYLLSGYEVPPRNCACGSARRQAAELLRQCYEAEPRSQS